MNTGDVARGYIPFWNLEKCEKEKKMPGTDAKKLIFFSTSFLQS
jgi:hypothetical protein